MQPKDQPLRRITAFISAVASARPNNRLVLYMFRPRFSSDPLTWPRRPKKKSSKDAEASTSNVGGGEIALARKSEKRDSRAEASTSETTLERTRGRTRHTREEELEQSSKGKASTSEPKARTRPIGARYPKEEDEVYPLNLLTLLINRRYIFDYLKDELPPDW